VKHRIITESLVTAYTVLSHCVQLSTACYDVFKLCTAGHYQLVTAKYAVFGNGLLPVWSRSDHELYL